MNFIKDFLTTINNFLNSIFATRNETQSKLEFRLKERKKEYKNQYNNLFCESTKEECDFLIQFIENNNIFLENTNKKFTQKRILNKDLQYIDLFQFENQKEERVRINPYVFDDIKKTYYKLRKKINL
ncbi:MAG: hypothetical protein DBY41_07470 [Clostridium sp.]|nr:MAG: hypothetical protein DBY41_07470 [Clostridium sp.]